MRRPEPTWETDYQHDRRAHRHRCRCCNRIIDTGERVLMAQVAGGKVWAIHIECADRPHPCGTWRDAMTVWGLEGLRRLGWGAAVA